MVSPRKTLKVAHISDLHVGSPHFDPNLLNRAIMEVNEEEPDVLIITGDLTNDGFQREYSAAQAYVENFECPHKVIVPGNHDSRNVGYVHFEDMFGSRNSVHYLPGITVLAVDSTQPDLNEGKLGRQNYRWIVQQFAREDDFKVMAMHHHLISIPGTGRERNIIEDAGDVLELLVEIGVDMVLSGHKHVPYCWRFEDIYLVNAGTVSSLRVRGYAKPCYNVIDIRGDRCTIRQRYPFGESMEVLAFPINDKAAPRNEKVR